MGPRPSVAENKYTYATPGAPTNQFRPRHAVDRSHTSPPPPPNAPRGRPIRNRLHGALEPNPASMWAPRIPLPHMSLGRAIPRPSRTTPPQPKGPLSQREKIPNARKATRTPTRSQPRPPPPAPPPPPPPPPAAAAAAFDGEDPEGRGRSATSAPAPTRGDPSEEEGEEEGAAVPPRPAAAQPPPPGPKP